MTRYEVNPFIAKTKIKLGYTLNELQGQVEERYRKERIKGDYTIEQDDVVTTTKALKTYEDRTNHVKFYEGFNLLDFNKQGLVVMQYILQHKNLYNAYHLFIPSNGARMVMNVTERVIKLGIKNLIEKGYIAKSTMNGYWLNVDRFFKGKRYDVISREAEINIQLEKYGRQIAPLRSIPKVLKKDKNG